MFRTLGQLPDVTDLQMFFLQMSDLKCLGAASAPVLWKALPFPHLHEHVPNECPHLATESGVPVESMKSKLLKSEIHPLHGEGSARSRTLWASVSVSAGRLRVRLALYDSVEPPDRVSAPPTHPAGRCAIRWAGKK